MKRFILIILFILFINISAYAVDDNEQYMNFDWWKNFNDEYLLDNLSKVYLNNYDLKNAALKVDANEQVVKMQFANELPFVSFSGEISRDIRAPREKFGNMSIPHYSQNNFYLPITAGYEIDIWGKNRLKTKSKKQQLEIVKQAQRATYISLSSAFASDYFNLIKTDKLIEIQQELLDVQNEIFSKTNEKYNIGLVPVTEVLFQEKVLNTLQEEHNNYVRTRELLLNNLKVYLANQNEEVVRKNFDDVSVINNLPEEYNVSIVENRPDYLQEEANIKKIGFDVKVAKKEFLPSFTIFGQIGLNAYSLSTLCNSPSQLFAAGFLPNFDIFSGGKKRAMLKMQKYRYEEALNNYQKTYLNAISEMNSGLIDYKTSKKNYEESLGKISIEEKIYSLAKDKREIGSSNDLDVLFVKEMYLLAEKELVSNKINSILSVIGLYKVSGGIDLYKLNDDNTL